VTTALAIACGVLAVLAGVLLVALVGPRLRRRRAAKAADRAPTPAVEQLAQDLHVALAQYRAEAEQPPEVSRATITPALRPAPSASRPVSPDRRPARARPRRAAPRPAPRGQEPAPSPLSGNGELQELLRQALTTAQTIPGADASALALPAWHEPLLGTLGLARHEADRLAGTLPPTGARTRSVAIEYEYEHDYDDGASPAPSRLHHGIAVPIPGLPTPGLMMVLTRAPDVELGAAQVRLLEEIVERMAPALARVLQWDAAATPVAVTIRERADERTPRPSVQGQEGQEVAQLDRFENR
jgi:hypothetical protein